ENRPLYESKNDSKRGRNQDSGGRSIIFNSPSTSSGTSHRTSPNTSNTSS
ncbi:unnamed protein product, partial [Rotaria sp. Silwood2]